MNGFVVGGSLPLFQNRKKVKIASTGYQRTIDARKC